MMSGVGMPSASQVMVIVWPSLASTSGGGLTTTVGRAVANQTQIFTEYAPNSKQMYVHVGIHLHTHLYTHVRKMITAALG